MFDVLHVLFEEDITPMWEQHIDVKDRVREAVYRLLYGREYEFATTKATGNSAPQGFEDDQNWQGPNASPESVDRKREIKPYIPPTSEEDLLRVLGPPMGG